MHFSCSSKNSSRRRSSRMPRQSGGLKNRWELLPRQAFFIILNLRPVSLICYFFQNHFKSTEYIILTNIMPLDQYAFGQSCQGVGGSASCKPLGSAEIAVFDAIDVHHRCSFYSNVSSTLQANLFPKPRNSLKEIIIWACFSLFPEDFYRPPV